MTKKRLIRITPLRAGQVLGTFFGALTLVIIPLYLMGIVPLPPEAGGNVGVVFVAPLFNAMAGFILGSLAAAVYNLTVRITGGLEFEITEESVAPQQFVNDSSRR